MKQSTCLTCEETFQSEALLKHRAIHVETEASYRCQEPQCQFRSPQRKHLMSHYLQVHGDIRLLWCPFCPYTETVRTARNTRKVANFIKHCRTHATGDTDARCPKCAYQFGTQAEVQKHLRKDHGRVALSPGCLKKLTMDENANSSAQAETQPLIANEAPQAVCSVPTATTLHIERGGLNKGAIKSVKQICQCGFATFDEIRLAHHRKECNNGNAVMAIPLPPRPINDPTLTPDDLHEATVFAVLQPKHQNPRPAKLKGHYDSVNMKFAFFLDEFNDVDEKSIGKTATFLRRVRDDAIAKDLKASTSTMHEA
ncbi:unnamed protein product, partial [Mesorhabditis spiculigera]